MTPYQKHKLDWLSCERCPLHERRKNVVLVRGKLPCDVLLVGEAPGINEDALGKPFIGPAGKLLDRIIQEAGGDKWRLAFTNVVACIPWGEDGKKVSDPPKVAVEKCHPRLTELIGIAKPTKVVCVGLVAAKYVLGDATITHPAAILRANPAEQGLMYQRNVVALADLFESLIPF